MKEQIEDRMKDARNNLFETEDQILLCSVTDEGTELDIEQCKRLFSLPATINFISDLVGDVKVENEHTPCPSQEGNISRGE